MVQVALMVGVHLVGEEEVEWVGVEVACHLEGFEWV